MTTANDPPDPGNAPRDEPSGADREVRYEHTKSLVGLLAHLGCSLLVSTYQAGKLVAVAADPPRLALSFHNFERAMGLAVGPGTIAVGARQQVWLMNSAPDVAPHLPPPGRHDACFLTNYSYFTGPIDVHELAWAGSELWAVNTLFSCLCTLDGRYSFVPRWRPPFITALAAEDRCHLNGLAIEGGRPRYVTALGEADIKEGWRPGKVGGGVLLEVPSGRVAARGFAMPHSPRLRDGRLWLLDSGRGQLAVVDPATGSTTPAAHVPGYARGLAFCGGFAFIGLSKVRKSGAFGGVPVAGRPEELKCGVAAVELRTGEVVAWLEFHSGVEEVFDVQVLEGVRWPALSGPHPQTDGQQPIWRVPPLAPLT
jgi:uncharacterized protein (TIGR03032 family)